MASAYLIFDEVAGDESLGFQRLDDDIELFFFAPERGVCVACFLTKPVIFAPDVKVGRKRSARSGCARWCSTPRAIDTRS
jgi:hypothetical protein